jgi:regulation of enolase protein 1 (concanavalin A-like superfamily)
MHGVKLSRVALDVVLLLICIASQTANAQYVHPGGLHTKADLDRMKTQVAARAHPWIDDWDLLIADPLAQNTYKAAATPNMGSSRQRADQDAHAAYLNAIRWYISGDTSYADAAVRILNAWSSAVNQVPTGTDIPGLIGISIQDFALAGEVLRIYPGWSAANITAFKKMFTNYLYPVVNTFLTTHNGACISHYWANWDAANIGALIAMGVFNDNTAWFNQGVAYYEGGDGNGSIANAIYHLWPGNLGQWQEAGRDQEHDQLGVGLLGYAAQTAWNQGVDLFGYSSDRLLAGAEYTARYNTNQSVPYTTYNNCDNVRQYYVSANGRGRLDDRPVWELIYNHYNVRQGLSTPNSQAMAQLMRPEHGSADHFGYGTLTFTLNAAASPYPPSAIPATPTGLTATAGVGMVYLNWTSSSTANGYNVLRSTNGGTYTNIASLRATTSPQYKDAAVTNGTAYSYEVEAVNQSGTGAASSSSSATPKAAGALPAGWLDADIGTVQTAGSGRYATVSNDNFLVTGQGRGIGGTADSLHFSYMQVTGDFTFVARLTGITGTALNDTGIMMRETLNSNAAAITMVQGTTGWRIAQMGTRSGTGGTMSWVTGDQYTTMPVWLKLQRAGNVFTAYQSSDGVTWFSVGTSTLVMANTYYVGLVACSGDVTNNTTETSNFDNVGPISNSQNNPIANGTYVIKSVYSGLTIDDPASSKTLGQVMQQSTVNNGANQQWTVNNLGNNVITLTNVASGLALDVTGGSKANSALVDQYTYQGNAWQKWNVISLGGGSYELTSVNSGLALDVVGGVKTVGAQIDQYPYRGNAWQQWTFAAR